MPKPILQSLILADHVYEDKLTGKRIIAGVFNRIIRGVRVVREVPQPTPALPYQPPQYQPPQPSHPVQPVQPLAADPGAARGADSAGRADRRASGTAVGAERVSDAVSRRDKSSAARLLAAHPSAGAASAFAAAERARSGDTRGPARPADTGHPVHAPPSSTPVHAARRVWPATAELARGTDHASQPTAPPPHQPTQRVLEIPPTGLQSGSPFAYLSLTEVRGVTPLLLQLVNLEDDTQLFRSDLRVECHNPLYTVELTVPLPPIAPPQAGIYALELLYNNELLGRCGLLSKTQRNRNRTAKFESRNSKRIQMTKHECSEPAVFRLPHLNFVF